MGCCIYFLVSWWSELNNLFIYSRYVFESCFSHYQSWYKLHWLILTFRMFVQLGIPEYILIWNFGFFVVGTYNVMFAWKSVQHFQQRVSCVISSCMVYKILLWSPYMLYYCYLLPCYILQWSREATTWNRFQYNWHVEPCFKYGGFLSTMDVHMLNVTASCVSLYSYLMLMCQLQCCSS